MRERSGLSQYFSKILEVAKTFDTLRYKRYCAILAVAVPERELDFCELSVTNDEYIRFNQYKFLMDRNRSLVAWTVLRDLLGVILGIEPRAVEIVRNNYGKPKLLNGPSFSLSHSNKISMVALSNGQSIGVDIEKLKASDWDYSGVIDVLNTIEKEYLADSTARHTFLLRAWTRKEAAAKAIGCGFSIDFRLMPLLTKSGRSFFCSIAYKKEHLNIYGEDIDLNEFYVSSVASLEPIEEIKVYSVASAFSN